MEILVLKFISCGSLLYILWRFYGLEDCSGSSRLDFEKVCDASFFFNNFSTILRILFSVNGYYKSRLDRSKVLKISCLKSTVKFVKSRILNENLQCFENISKNWKFCSFNLESWNIEFIVFANFYRNFAKFMNPGLTNIITFWTSNRSKFK